MFSQIFILSPRGDTIINRDFRSDLPKSTPETFFRQAKTYSGDANPLFNVDCIQFAHIKRGGLYIVGTSRFNLQPAMSLELLDRLAKEIKDFCGVINEEVLRKNFILIYEILDESFDFGYPQLMATEQIKPLIVNEPIQPQPDSVMNSLRPKIQTFNIFVPNTMGSQAVQRSVLNKNQANEIFVDIYEKLNVLFNSSAYVINQSIEGCIQMTSFLQGNPPLKLALNEDLQIGRQQGQYSAGVILDDCNFHECVNANELDMNKTLRIQPPDGQFVVMNYRISGDYAAPFRLFPIIEEISSSKIEVTIKLKACFDAKIIASYANVRIPIPKQTANAYPELVKNAQQETAEYDSNKKIIEWQIKKLCGGQERSLKIKLTLQATQTAHTARKEIGPIAMNFEIPMFNVSRLQIKYLRIEERGNTTNPHRWVRYITQSSSYVCRI
ncbi:unnamed protein product [Paramecium primaurelia]|uniref:MHD domain-containing protein n=1 Tax=Paramecium primaurelia TaxID=5886 RepID=A0A8S1P9I9_PARPR|nr:unnamed protein product [Paramecium primaurelia]